MYVFFFLSIFQSAIRLSYDLCQMESGTQSNGVECSLEFGDFIKGIRNRMFVISVVIFSTLIFFFSNFFGGLFWKMASLYFWSFC